MPLTLCVGTLCCSAPFPSHSCLPSGVWFIGLIGLLLIFFWLGLVRLSILFCLPGYSSTVASAPGLRAVAIVDDFSSGPHASILSAFGHLVEVSPSFGLV